MVQGPHHRARSLSPLKLSVSLSGGKEKVAVDLGHVKVIKGKVSVHAPTRGPHTSAELARPVSGTEHGAVSSLPYGILPEQHGLRVVRLHKLHVFLIPNPESRIPNPDSRIPPPPTAYDT